MHTETEKYLSHIGLKRVEETQEGIKLYYLCNTDGSIRWLWNANNPHPDFLRFYSVTSTKSFLMKVIIKGLFMLRLQHLLLRKNTMRVAHTDSHPLSDYFLGNFSLFTGTPGPNRKLLLYSQNQFLKIALNNNSKACLQNELLHLNQIRPSNHVQLPVVGSISPEIIKLSDLGARGKRQRAFSFLHALALQEIQEPFGSQIMACSESEVFQQASLALTNKEGISQHQIPTFLRDKLTLIQDELTHESLIFTWGHGDFTPWNCYVEKGKIQLFDFELAHYSLPLGFDAFHFVMQQAILVERKSWKQMVPMLENAFEKVHPNAKAGREVFIKYLKAYLFINISYHIQLYSGQEKWHEQIQWLFNTWNEACSDLTATENSSRALLIGDMFDFLQNKPYAAIKFPNIHPSELGEGSDIDLLMNRQQGMAFMAYVKHHPLVLRVKIKQLSCMGRMMIVMKNHQLLAVDMIWLLKRRSLVFMNTQEALTKAVTNDYGIKILHPQDLRNYILHFYLLNGGDIPDRYKTLIDQTPEESFTAKDLRNKLHALAVNKGMSGAIHRLRYLMDGLRNMIHDQGIIVTFSGVDGSGKSTVIEQMKNITEKKLRKNVVVLRHRPSLLPILSSMKHGKQKAEWMAATTLPRQGQNKNILSSLLRFGYYYFDYLFGQFYVYIKHVRRGKIVLYDRYYFDFINDGLRSNIALPKWFKKAGYKLLLTPHLNFYLYADAQTIRNRKKELEEHTITELTQDYLRLFSDLEANTSNHYFPLENLQLEHTLEFITHKMQAKLF